MFKHSPIAAALSSLTTLAMAGCAANGGTTPAAPPATQPQAGRISSDRMAPKDGILYHVSHYMATRGHAVRNSRA